MTEPELERWKAMLEEAVTDAIRKNIHPSVLRDPPTTEEEPDEPEEPADD